MERNGKEREKMDIDMVSMRDSRMVIVESSGTYLRQT